MRAQWHCGPCRSVQPDYRAGPGDYNGGGCGACARTCPYPESGPSACASSRPGEPEAYYALFRAGFPANADGLFQASPKAVQAVWEQASKQGVIPQSLSGEIAGAVQTFTTLSASHTLGAKPPVGISSMQQMLQASLPNVTPQQQQQFALLYAQHRDDMTTFWSQIETSFGAPTAKLLQLHGQLYYLTMNNAPLVSALDSAERQTPLTSTLDLATRGYYDPSKWVPLIGNSIPTEIPGKTADERRGNYAQLLATQVRLSFPTAVVADRVKNGTFPLLDPTKQGDVTKFLNDNQGKFEIGIEPIKAYLARTKLAATPAVVTEITRFQRVHQLTRDDQTMGILLQHKLDSAYAIIRYDSAGFARAFSSKLGGKDAANRICARAKQIHGAVLNIAMSYLVARRAPTPGGPSPIHIPPPHAIGRGTIPADYGWTDILIEQLGISREEYPLFTDSNTVNLQALYGYLANFDALTALQTMSLQDFSRRTGVSYDDLFSIVKTQFVNPNAILIPRLEKLNVPFKTLEELNSGKLPADQFKALLPAQLDATQYGGKTPTDKDAVVTWVKNNYALIKNIVTITNPNPVSDIDQCSGSTLQFRYSNPDNTANELTATDFVKLIRFIRLWQKLGLSIEQTDDLLSALYPTGHNESLDQDFITFLLRAVSSSKS